MDASELRSLLADIRSVADAPQAAGGLRQRVDALKKFLTEQAESLEEWELAVDLLLSERSALAAAGSWALGVPEADDVGIFGSLEASARSESVGSVYTIILTRLCACKRTV